MFNELKQEEAQKINGGNPLIVGIVAVGGFLAAATELHNLAEGIYDGMKGVSNHNGKFGK